MQRVPIVPVLISALLLLCGAAYYVRRDGDGGVTTPSPAGSDTVRVVTWRLSSQAGSPSDRRPGFRVEGVVDAIASLGADVVGLGGTNSGSWMDALCNDLGGAWRYEAVPAIDRRAVGHALLVSPSIVAGERRGVRLSEQVRAIGWSVSTGGDFTALIIAVDVGVLSVDEAGRCLERLQTWLATQRESHVVVVGWFGGLPADGASATAGAPRNSIPMEWRSCVPAAGGDEWPAEHVYLARGRARVHHSVAAATSIAAAAGNEYQPRVIDMQFIVER